MIISTEFEDNSWGVSQNNKIHLRWREQEDGKWVRKEKKETFRPYLFVDPENLFMKRQKEKFSKQWKTLATYKFIPPHLVKATIKDYMYGIDIDFEEGDFVNTEGTKLLKVILQNPMDARRFRKNFTRTYEADVPIEDRYLVDNYEELPEYEMRKLFIDLEALQFKSGDGPEQVLRPNDPRDNQEINVIGAYDSYTKRYYQWCMFRDYDEETEVKTFEGESMVVKKFNDEGRMLQDFVDFVDILDPDCILAWGMGFYDLPTLYRRLESTGVGSHKLLPSSMGRKRVMKPPRFKGVQYRWTEQPVPGRVIISLDKLYERIYRDSKSTNLPSMKLDVVGQALFGRGKTEFRPDFYDADYDKFMDDYLYYNYIDVKLMVQIEESCNAIQGQQNLQALAKCQFKSTLYGSSYARVYFMRKADWKQESGWSDRAELAGDWELQGAIVLDPEELGTIGLHKNVTMLDFSGLYPSMMIAFNTSHETLVRKGEEQDDDIIGDRCRFRRNPVGMLPKCVMELDELRDEYKRLRGEAGETHGKGSDEYNKWDDAQKTVKRLRATFYGLCAFNGFAWANIDIARTITYGGRKSLMLIKKECEKMGYEVIYGHTDSIFVKLGDEKTNEECAKLAVELGERLTEICQADLKSTAVEVEAETLMDRFYLPRRNRYAGRVVWDPSLKDPHSITKVELKRRIKMQGLEAKHANTAKIGRDVQYQALELIWDGASLEVVVDAMKKRIEDIREGRVDRKDMFSRARLGKWLPPNHPHPLIRQAATNSNATPDARDETDQCYSVLGGVHRAAAWYNMVLADDIYPAMDRGDSYYTTFANDGPTWIPSGGYIAFQDPEQIKDYTLDIEKIIEKNIIDKLDHMLYGIGGSNSVLREQKRQYRMEDFV